MSSSDDESIHPVNLGPDFDPTGFDIVTFSQILEMDDDTENRTFSLELVVDYLNQAQDTFEKIRVAIEKENLNELSELGHFLKGSSAALGLAQVSSTCAKIQDYGKKIKDGEPIESDDTALGLIQTALNTVWGQYEHVRGTLIKFYKLEEDSESESEAGGNVDEKDDDADDDEGKE